MGKFASKLDIESLPVVLNLEIVQAMLEQWNDTYKIENLELLYGGLRNTNYKVKLAGRKEPIILRLYSNDLITFKKEIAILQHIHNEVPVPVPLFTNFQEQQPYAFISYIPDQTLDDVWDNLSKEELLAIFIDLGKILAKVHSFRFPVAGYLDENLRLIKQIKNLGQVYLDDIYSLLLHPKTLSKSQLNFVNPLIKILQNNEELLTTLSLTNRLVHNDFNPKNIRVSQRENKWKVSGIIDWELSFSGSPLIDIGNFLRFEDEMPPQTKDYLIAGYLSGGGNLPSQWRKISLILDLVVMGEWLAKKADKSESFQTAVKICQKTVARLR